MEFTAAQVASFIGGNVDGDAAAKLSNFAKIEQGKAGDLCFLSNMVYEHYIYTTEASAVIVAEDFVPSAKVSAALIRVKNPYEAFAKLMTLAEAQKPKNKGVAELAFVAAGVHVPESCFVGEFSVIQAGSAIGENTQIHPQVFIGENVKIGSDVILYPGVKIMHDCVIGDRVILNPGVVVGTDGFGFAPDANGHFSKIPQLGNVIIEDDVEVGANTTIDRATMGSTRVGKGTKLDNLIMIAHNCEIGEHNVFAAQAGVAGSTKIGDHNQVGGQVGFAGHLKIGSYCRFAAQSGIMDSLDDHSSVMGAPAVSATRFFKIYSIFKKLDEIAFRVNALEKK
ncbi:MAG: UDP-3-O-(3-hydroxymyristoyl)glucosamine N-acyltransferase [Bacteroidetes bacterium GWF2_43_63]|nr:MAG: UDP-3-O-(3-hydroxymyristoyl)glucosamine N-acyltransferase [Bacteroidetes bacterium GWE2_42_42]OFY54150.1 MAG: UDP-3-O-(3-hydroxymyristoyl)glucosamine N-acyltransferase [Bacteroidetes bacterium GWF2_43_63]HBG70812.1 UDP-3-O-(3-hydroxymyristoyl)glucosamine N-acyltransferase [Bacteroidales bacterium]HCB61716.1 UDP-3-O-(3-hydroxymyristoyl)glucosamine N-acyltransferase [Bacteroidales bacterium]HCY22092.1 UDP-3-O-(3-hydroxymyristoyl)glucosamine N-acyltransferase [Bacteroidales bacterium]